MFKWCVYVGYSGGGEALYVGQSSRIVLRLNEHKRYSSWWSECTYVELFPCSSEAEALKMEEGFIYSLSPKYNKSERQGVANFSYPTLESFERINIERILSICKYGGKISSKDKALYRSVIEEALEGNGVPREYVDVNVTMGCIRATYSLHKDMFEDIFIHEMLLKDLSSKYNRDKSWFSYVKSGKRLQTAVKGWARYCLDEYGSAHKQTLTKIAEWVDEDLEVYNIPHFIDVVQIHIKRYL